MQTNNKLREALSDACYAMFNFLKTQYGGYEEMANALDKAKAALAEPVRNCEVGTTEEQSRRFLKYCVKQDCEKTCPFRDCKNSHECAFAWAQMPYEEGGVS